MKFDTTVRAENHYLVFFLDDQRYSLHLPTVESVARMVYITPLPGAPEIVLGVVNLRGKVVPIVDIRERFDLPKREILLTDWLIFAYTTTRLVGLAVNSVMGVAECLEQCVVPTDEFFPPLKYLKGVIKFQDGLILIQNLGEFLSLEEEKSLDLALSTS
ncbi:MAG: chemotaxis protein CheW [Nitrosomonadales bacterium SCN 54-20]|nr:MAG: chemotaxis protein CheW [Nitrosomonadales bacterium SCN 54-20]